MGNITVSTVATPLRKCHSLKLGSPSLSEHVSLSFSFHTENQGSLWQQSKPLQNPSEYTGGWEGDVWIPVAQSGSNSGAHVAEEVALSSPRTNSTYIGAFHKLYADGFYFQLSPGGFASSRSFCRASLMGNRMKTTRTWSVLMPLRPTSLPWKSTMAGWSKISSRYAEL